MERFFKRKSSDLSSPLIQTERSKQSCIEINLGGDLPSNPGLRIKILEYHPDLRDQIRREYLLRGPCQPKDHVFVQTQKGESKHGQCYDGASNMSGELNGLKTLIFKENPSAFYVHCFAHQLQLALVGVAKKHEIVGAFFTSVASVVNIIGASSKRRDILREKQALKVVEALKIGELTSGKGLNQETEIKRASDTLWSSHYGTLINFTFLSSIIDVLDEIAYDKVSSDQKHEAYISLKLLQSFDYIFSLHLMRIILGTTHELSQALPRADQDIVNAMELVEVCKGRLQTMRESGWFSLLEEVVIFCGKMNVSIPNMDDQYVWKNQGVELQK